MRLSIFSSILMFCVNALPKMYFSSIKGNDNSKLLAFEWKEYYLRQYCHDSRAIWVSLGTVSQVDTANISTWDAMWYLRLSHSVESIEEHCTFRRSIHLPKTRFLNWSIYYYSCQKEKIFVLFELFIWIPFGSFAFLIKESRQQSRI